MVSTANEGQLNTKAITLNAILFFVVLSVQGANFFVVDDFGAFRFMVEVVKFVLYFMIQTVFLVIMLTFESEFELTCQVHQDGMVEIIALDCDQREVFRYYLGKVASDPTTGATKQLKDDEASILSSDVDSLSLIDSPQSSGDKFDLESPKFKETPKTPDGSNKSADFSVTKSVT